MEINLLDYLGQKICIGDIVKREQLISSTIEYFLLKKDNNELYLFRCDATRDNEFNQFIDLHIDGGISLLNDNTWRWIRIGPKEEVSINLGIRL